MNKELQVIARVAVFAVCAGVSAGVHSHASAQEPILCDRKFNNDKMYCRFESTDLYVSEGVLGDVSHMERVTGVPGRYWYTERGNVWHDEPETDVYAFYWCYMPDDESAAGVAIRFTRGGGRAIEMLGTLGFQPSVPYWQCDEKTWDAP